MSMAALDGFEKIVESNLVKPQPTTQLLVLTTSVGGTWHIHLVLTVVASSGFSAPPWFCRRLHLQRSEDVQ